MAKEIIRGGPNGGQVDYKQFKKFGFWGSTGILILGVLIVVAICLTMERIQKSNAPVATSATQAENGSKSVSITDSTWVGMRVDALAWKSWPTKDIWWEVIVNDDPQRYRLVPPGKKIGTDEIDLGPDVKSIKCKIYANQQVSECELKYVASK